MSARPLAVTACLPHRVQTLGAPFGEVAWLFALPRAFGPLKSGLRWRRHVPALIPGFPPLCNTCLAALRLQGQGG